MINYDPRQDHQPHMVYLVLLSGVTTLEVFGKVGITAKPSVKDRFEGIPHYVLIDEYEFKCKDGIEARGLESILTHKVIPWNDLKYTPRQTLNGYTECFKSSALEDLVALLNANYISLSTNQIQPISMLEYMRRHPDYKPPQNLPDYME